MAQPGGREGFNVPGVRANFFFASGFLSISFRLQSMATLKEGDHWQMWEFIPSRIEVLRPVQSLKS